MKVLFLAAMLLAAPGLYAQQDDDEWLEDCEGYERRRRVAHCEIRNTGYRQTAGSMLTAEPNQNGGVSVRGWDRDSVHVKTRIRAVARTEEQARALAGEVRISAERGSVSATGPSSDRDANWNVSFIIYVPRQTNVRAETHNGPISLAELEGNIEVRATNGPISIRDLAGDVRARTQNGPLTVRLSGSRWRGAGLDAETQNGPMVLYVPEGYNAQLETGTTNGPMSIGFPIMVSGRGIEKRITTTLGDGGPTIRARTQNGPLALRRP
ncbi:MAG: DUF4097 family beta strand repeat-containing protein [Gemmatimonadaceae bacterium]